MREKIIRILESDVHSGEAWHASYWQEYRQYLTNRILTLISEEVERAELVNMDIEGKDNDIVSFIDFWAGAKAQHQKILSLLKE